jgi:hypothetical protein
VDPIEQAILATIAYADIFQFPLSAFEVHRYLIGSRATVEEVRSAIEQSRWLASCLDQAEGYYALCGRMNNFAIRRQRLRFSAGLWPRAIRYGRLIASLPFVRMVAVTGSLAMNNADSQADLDYLVVTRPGRLWTARAIVIAVVKLAGRSRDALCPNYFLSERALALQDQNLFTAHELAQMVPLSGMPVYRQIRALNPWVEDYLPNSGLHEDTTYSSVEKTSIIKPMGEFLLGTTAINPLESWEMNRKVRKLTSHGKDQPEAEFSTDQCKGHFGGHRQRILDAFSARTRALQEMTA